MARLGSRPRIRLGVFILWVAKGFSGCALPSGRASGCQQPVLDGKQGAAQHPQLPWAAVSSMEQEQGAHGEQGLRGRRPPGIALHHRLNRTEGNEHCPIISPLIGLWGFASMEKQSSPARWAQPGATPLWACHWHAAFLQSLLLLQVPPWGTPVPTPAPASHAPSPQLSTPLGMSPKATPFGTLGRWQGAAGCREPLARSQTNSSALLRDSQPNGLHDAAAVTQSSSGGEGERVNTRPRSREEGLDAPRAQAAPAASSGTGESRALYTGRGRTRAHHPTARSNFPCWGKLRHGKRLCITQGGKCQVSCIAGQCRSSPPSGSRAEDVANCGSRMSPMGKLQPFGLRGTGCFWAPREPAQGPAPCSVGVPKVIP